MRGALQARFLWLLVPALGLVELGAELAVAHRAPTLDQWRALAPVVAGMKRAGEPLVVAPEWAEPIARHVLGDAAFPLAELARSDIEDYPRALELSLLGGRSAEASGFRVVGERESGPFTLRTLENPSPRRSTYRLLDHLTPAELEVTVVTDGAERPCEFTGAARAVTGGLHGEVAFPRARFRCGPRESDFVGITVIDDQQYRPRRCVWAQPPPRGSLRLRLSGVPLGRSLVGFAGLSYFLFRDGGREPVELTAWVAGERLSSYRHEDEWGWRGFSLGTGRHAGTTADLVLEVRAEHAAARDFCFVLESVP